MSISSSNFHQEKEDKMDHGRDGVGEETKNLQEIRCSNCGKIGDHLTKDCGSGIYGRQRKYSQNTIRFRNLSEDTHRDELRWMCLTYGPVARVTGPEIKELGDRGLVAFENKEDAQMAIEKLNGSTFKGRVITVEWAKKNNVPDLKKNICRHCDKNDWDWVALNSIGKYVRNGNAIRVRDFAGETDRSDISSICRTFGPVACVFEHGLNYEGKRHLGLLAGFENKEDAQKAIEKFNGSVFKVRVLTVEWAKKKNENSP